MTMTHRRSAGDECGGGSICEVRGVLLCGSLLLVSALLPSGAAQQNGVESNPGSIPSDPKLATVRPVEIPTATSEDPVASPAEEISAPGDSILRVATTLHGGLKQAGCMFDVYVPSAEGGGPPEGITVVGIETSTFLLEDIYVEVYSKEGTYDGFETNPPAWSILGAATMEGGGERQPARLPLGSLDPVYMPAGTRRGFYVTMMVPEMRYTQPRYGEVSGEVFSESPKGHLGLMVGSAASYPFGEVWRDRIFNGAVLYVLGDATERSYGDADAGDTPEGLSTLGIILVVVGTLLLAEALAAVRMRRRSRRERAGHAHSDASDGKKIGASLRPVTSSPARNPAVHMVAAKMVPEEDGTTTSPASTSATCSTRCLSIKAPNPPTGGT